MLLGFFLAVKDRPLDAFDLYNRADATWAKNNALRVASGEASLVPFWLPMQMTFRLTFREQHI